MSSAIHNFTPCGRGRISATPAERSPALNWRASVSRIALPAAQNEAFGISRLSLCSSSRKVNDRTVRMALVDKPRLARGTRVAEPPGVLAYELVQGPLVEWSSSRDKSVADPPTAVLLHGILGSRKNWGTFARRLAQEFPMWQFLLVDLRCHGDSASVKRRGAHSVASTALDVLKLHESTNGSTTMDMDERQWFSNGSCLWNIDPAVEGESRDPNWRASVSRNTRFRPLSLGLNRPMFSELPWMILV